MVEISDKSLLKKKAASIEVREEEKRKREKDFAQQYENLGFEAEDFEDRDLVLLDFGCGAGGLVSGLLKRGINAYGIDLKEEIEETKKQLPQECRGRFFEANLARKNPELPVEIKDLKFSIITAHAAFHPYTEEEGLEPIKNKIENLLNLLKPDGQLRITPVHPRDRWEGTGEREGILNKIYAELPQTNKFDYEIKYNGRGKKNKDDYYGTYLLIRKKRSAKKVNHLP